MFFQPLQGAGDVAAIMAVTICDPSKDKVRQPTHCKGD
jgi:hypothetical protein